MRLTEEIVREADNRSRLVPEILVQNRAYSLNGGTENLLGRRRHAVASDQGASFREKLSQAKRAGGVEISTWAHPDSEPETLPATIDRGGPGAMIGGPIRQVHSPMNSKNTARWPSR